MGSTGVIPGSNMTLPARNHAAEAAATILVMMPTLALGSTAHPIWSMLLS
jgi:hypothetical protein